MIFSLISIAILIYALKDYKKAFFIFIAYRLFYDGGVPLLLPGFPQVSLDQFFILSFIALFFYFRNKLRLDRSEFPYRIPFIMLSISWLISTIFALVGFTEVFVPYVYNVINNIALVWIMWYLVNDKNDIIFIVKSFTIAFLIAAIYAFFEKTTLSNPILEYKLNIAGDRAMAYGEGYLDADAGRGYRVRSFFRHPIGAGINWGLYCVMALIMVVKYNLRQNRLIILTALLCVPCVFLANSRSCIIFLFIGCLGQPHQISQNPIQSLSLPHDK